jgi:hypothetical protein
MKDLKFIAAMSAYLILAILAGFTLEGRIRLAVLIFLGGIAAKTVIVVLKSGLD